MNCISDNLIGVRCSPNDTSPEPISGLYLNDLPGLNVTLATSTADAEDISGVDLMHRAIRIASRLVESDVINLLRQDVQFVDLISQWVFGGYSDTETFVNGDGLKTIHLSTFDHDPYVFGQLDAIEFLLLDDGNLPATVTVNPIVDGIMGSPINFTPVEGYNRIECAIRFDQTLTLQFDNTNLVFSTDDITSSACRCLYKHQPCGQCIHVSTTDNGGAVLYTSCRGDICAVLERQQQTLATAILYRAGAYFLEEIIMSQRVNAYVRGGRENAEKLIDRWLGSTNTITGVPDEGEYRRQLERAVGSMRSMLKNTHSDALMKNQLRIYPAIP